MEYVVTLLNFIIIPFAAACLYKLLTDKKINITANLFITGIAMVALFGKISGIIIHIMYEEYNLNADISQLRVTPYIAFFAVVMPIVFVFIKKIFGVSVNISEKRTGKIKNGIVVPFIVTAVGVVMIAACLWMRNHYNIQLDEIIYTLTNSLEGADTTIVQNGVKDCLPMVILVLAFFTVVFVIARQNGFETFLNIRIANIRKTINLSRYHNIIIAMTVLVYALLNVIVQYDVLGYIKINLSKTTIYEDYYIAPDTVQITNDGQKRNLIYIYMESMETAYASTEEGGYQNVNYIPYLTQLAKEEVNFTDTGKLGGFHNTAGSVWTMGSLFSTTAGIPFSFPVENNNMSEYEGFAEGTVTLFDILEEEGYSQYFICGSNAEFGGRANYYRSHGNMTIYDLQTARDEGYIAEDYFVWWGYEDYTLYDISKDKLTEISQQEEPFSFVMLTVDTHFTDGYICDKCGDEYDSVAANVVSCADRQVEDFINWCKEQDFYEDTTIVIVGDHPRMDLALVEGISDYNRTSYACFVNAADKNGYSTNRSYTQMDMFPTVLGAMGYEIEGNRLGLGANLFSDVPTLAEELGFEYLNIELQKGSDYYLANFN